MHEGCITRQNAAMCVNYTPPTRERLQAAPFSLMPLPEVLWPAETFPGYDAPLMVRVGAAGRHDLAPRCVPARFGLVPRWSEDAAHARTLSRHTTNARSETVAVKPSFRHPWRERRWALAPMDHFFEPCWETGQAVRWRIARADAQPCAAAALWEHWSDPASGEVVTSFTLLTVNADAHPLMARMHRPGEEKRMPVLLAPAQFEAWLHASDEAAHALLHSGRLVPLAGTPVPRHPPEHLQQPRHRPPVPPQDGTLSLF